MDFLYKLKASKAKANRSMQSRITTIVDINHNELIRTIHVNQYSEPIYRISDHFTSEKIEKRTTLEMVENIWQLHLLYGEKVRLVKMVENIRNSNSPNLGYYFANSKSVQSQHIGMSSRSKLNMLQTQLFFKKFWRTQVLFVVSLIRLFWTSGDVCPGFQNQGGSLVCVLSCL